MAFPPFGKEAIAVVLALDSGQAAFGGFGEADFEHQGHAQRLLKANHRLGRGGFLDQGKRQDSCPKSRLIWHWDNGTGVGQTFN
jgi:hypothetical protein